MDALAAGLAAAVLSAMLFASRLPPGPDFLLPRRGGYALYRAAWALFDRPWGRAAFSVLVALLLAACAGLVAASWRRSLRARPRGAAAWVGVAIGPAFAALLAWRLTGRALDLLQSVLFPYGGMDAREPLAAFLLFAAGFVSAAAAARAWLAGRRREATLLLAALVVADLSFGAVNAWRGVGRGLGLPEPAGKTVYVLLTEGEHGPGSESYVLAPDVFSGPDPRAALEALARRGEDARALPALRALYEEETKRWDLPGLRRALSLGLARRDLLAASVLLAHLRSAAPSAEALAALGAAADEDAWRVGPLGAAALARAYARLGDAASARRWAERAGGPAGVAAGLLGADAGGALRPGRVSGRVRVGGPVRVALYARPDPGAPYLLDASGLVASAVPDAAGRFRFEGLPAGRYALAFAVPLTESRRGEVSVTGNRGDLVLDARRPSLDLPPLTLSISPR